MKYVNKLKTTSTARLITTVCQPSKHQHLQKICFHKASSTTQHQLTLTGLTVFATMTGNINGPQTTWRNLLLWYKYSLSSTPVSNYYIRTLPLTHHASTVITISDTTNILTVKNWSTLPKVFLTRVKWNHCAVKGLLFTKRFTASKHTSPTWEYCSFPIVFLGHDVITNAQIFRKQKNSIFILP